MAKREKTNMVTRRVIVSRTYDIYSVEGESMKKIDTREIKGRVNTKSLASEYNVPLVVAVEIAINKKVYGVPIDDFMAIAKEVTTKAD